MSEEEKVNKNLWHASVVTLFPDLFPGPLNISVTGKALERGEWRLNDRLHSRFCHR